MTSAAGKKGTITAAFLAAALVAATAQDTLRFVCNAIFADPKPDVLIDAVRTPGSTVDKLSTAVRDTARRMGLPTLSLTYGVHNDYTLSGWDRLTALEREFLVHVTPPGDIYTQVIRDLCKKMDLSTAGIIYDSSENYTPKCSECSNVTFIVATPEPTNADLLAAAKKDKEFEVQKEQAAEYDLAGEMLHSKGFGAALEV
ncbi:hypothetical protein HPB49_012927 [Dermacentor silvarum]|uniref:Uncharacterized protein n=1 Tax=Dermacentor silvarum TaxID=543639 RepID=A0ACB8E0C1_DERSI|nr:hypothetical protein HPB49_012927 [Dermacentor silvarum]